MYCFMKKNADEKNFRTFNRHIMVEIEFFFKLKIIISILVLFINGVAYAGNRQVFQSLYPCD